MPNYGIQMKVSGLESLLHSDLEHYLNVLRFLGERYTVMHSVSDSV